MFKVKFANKFEGVVQSFSKKLVCYPLLPKGLCLMLFMFCLMPPIIPGIENAIEFMLIWFGMLFMPEVMRSVDVTWLLWEETILLLSGTLFEASPPLSSSLPTYKNNFANNFEYQPISPIVGVILAPPAIFFVCGMVVTLIQSG